MSSILRPITLGGSLVLRNRVVHGFNDANRCINDGMPTEATSDYYSERARHGTGLIIAEGTFVAPHGAEWPHAPVMYTKDHSRAWKKVVEDVHNAEGKIFFSHGTQHEDMPLLKKTGHPVLAPSKIPAKGGKFRLLPGAPGHTSNITEIEDPKVIVQQYKFAVTLAKEAGFDGIELLSQGGYLLHNFLCSHANKRADQYGGSVENRCRFPLEVLDAIIEVWGPHRIGIKICPPDDYNDSTVSYEELTETYSYYINQLVSRELGYINLSRRGCAIGRDQDDYFKSSPRPQGLELPPNYEPINQFGHMIKYPGSKTLLMVNHEYTVAEADDLISNDKIDLITFGRPFIYNPDIVPRIQKGVPFATNDRGGKVNYGPYRSVNEHYTDWPCAS